MKMSDMGYSFTVFEYVSFSQGTARVQDKAAMQKVQCILLAESQENFAKHW